MPYIEFTDSQKQRAAAVDLEAFLLSRGERLLREGRGKPPRQRPQRHGPQERMV